jgi:recombination endonuclease VII
MVVSRKKHARKATSKSRAKLAGYVYPDGRLTRAATVLKPKLLTLQGQLCKICQVKIDNVESAHLDHNHETGELRGVLCRGCNMGLGQFQDNPTILCYAADYLIRYGYTDPSYVAPALDQAISRNSPLFLKNRTYLTINP